MPPCASCSLSCPPGGLYPSDGDWPAVAPSESNLAWEEARSVVPCPQDTCPGGPLSTSQLSSGSLSTSVLRRGGLGRAYVHSLCDLVHWPQMGLPSSHLILLARHVVLYARVSTTLRLIFSRMKTHHPVIVRRPRALDGRGFRGHRYLTEDIPATLCVGIDMTETMKLQGAAEKPWKVFSHRGTERGESARYEGAKVNWSGDPHPRCLVSRYSASRAHTIPRWGFGHVANNFQKALHG